MKMKKSSPEIIIAILLLTTLSAILVFDKTPDNVSSFTTAKKTPDTQLTPSGEQQILSNQFLIKLKPSAKALIKKSPKSDDTGIRSLDKLNKEHKISKFEQLAKEGPKSKKGEKIFNWYKVTIDAPEKEIFLNSSEVADISIIMDSYRSDTNIETVEPDYVVYALEVPNDPYYHSNGSWNQSYYDMWGMRIIESEEAWNQTNGSYSIIVADIDTGVDRNHTELEGNMWINTGETPNNSVDDDSNGYVDDYYGWDWVNDDSDPMDDHGHGTHTVGTIAAVGNNSIGVVGVTWRLKIMALKFLSSSGSGSTSDGIAALHYAADMGARVSSNSWGSSGSSTSMSDAIQYEHDRGMVIVVAAGNSNGDALGHSPANVDRAVTIAASDTDDEKASFSNYGERIDVAAPGVNILSLKASTSPMCTSSKTVGTYYCKVSGTSMATPHVAGLAALLLSENSSLTNEEVRQIIRKGAVDLGDPGKDSDYGYGRINVSGSMNLVNSHPLTPIITSPKSRTTFPAGLAEVNGSVLGSNFSSYKLELGATRTPSSWTLVNNSTAQVINGTLGYVNTSQFVEDQQYILRLTANNTNNDTFQFQIYDLLVDNFEVSMDYPVGFVSAGPIDILGNAYTKNSTFDNYTIEWGFGMSPTNWSSSNINLTNGGLQPVNNSKLATWNTTNISFGQYQLRLNVTSGISSYKISKYQYLDQTLLGGWPKTLNITSGSGWATVVPTVADLDGDGVKEIVVPAWDGNIYVFAKNGSDFSNFPVNVSADAWFKYGANVADLDNDGKKEIIAVSGENNTIYVIMSNGTFYPGWPNPVFLSCWGNEPTIADLDRDGNKDIVTVNWEPQYYFTYENSTLEIHALRLDGSELTGFPKNYTLPQVNGDFPYSYCGPLSIVDLDRDGKLEIAWSVGNRIYLFNNSGDILPGWPFVAPKYNNYSMVFESAASSGDIDGDGNLELFSVGRRETCGGCSTQLYGWYKNGTVLSGWPRTDQTDDIHISYVPFIQTPSLADVDDDHKDEVVGGFYGELAIFDLEGKKNLTSTQTIDGQPSISDVDGDGNLEFGGGWANSLVISKQNNTSYSDYWERIVWGVDTIQFDAPGIFSDLDNNGKMEFITIGNIGEAMYLFVWEMDNTTNSIYEWPMFSHDSARSGRLNLFNFTMGANPASGSAAKGSSVNTAVSTTLTKGTTEPVNFSCSNLPTGASCSSSLPACNPNCSSTLTISTSSSTPAGQYSINITGNSTEISRVTTYTLTVTESTSPPPSTGGTTGDGTTGGGGSASELPITISIPNSTTIYLNESQDIVATLNNTVNFSIFDLSINITGLQSSWYSYNPSFIRVFPAKSLQSIAIRITPQERVNYTFNVVIGTPFARKIAAANLIVLERGLQEETTEEPTSEKIDYQPIIVAVVMMLLVVSSIIYIRRR